VANSRLTKTTLTNQPASLTCPFKYDLELINHAGGAETPVKLTVCVTTSADTEDLLALQGDFDVAVAAAGYDAIDYTI
jgi:hypothetical protein